MSLLTTSKFTLAGTKVEDTTSTVFSDIRMYDNESTYIGNSAAPSNIYGTRNTIIGYEAALNSYLAGNNVVVGSFAGKNINGQNNVIIGSDTGRNLTDSSDNIVLGKNTLQIAKKCTGNIVLGSLSGYNINEGNYNVLIGHNVFKRGNNISVSNTVIGSFSEGYGYKNTSLGETNYISGSNNSLVGNQNYVFSFNSLVFGYNNSNIGNDCIIIGNNIKNESDCLLNINDQIKSIQDNEQGQILVFSNKYGESNILINDSNIVLNTSHDLSILCHSTFSNDVVCSQNVKINTIDISSVCSFSSNIEIRHKQGCHWKIGLTNKSDDSSDLSFISKNQTVFTITDDFKPEILNFTGKHRCKLSDSTYISSLQIGMVMISTGQYCNLNDEYIIQIDESVPIVDVSKTSMDPRAFGVLCSIESENETTRNFNIGNIQFNIQKKSSRVVVNSVGEGAILVCNQNGKIKNGDFLTTSNKYGYAMKQSEPFYMNYTIAKSTCDCDFEEQHVALIGCTYKF
jgi:hypothetical protein